MFVSGFECINFSTVDKIMGFISHVRYNMMSTAIAIGAKYENFLSDRYEFVRNEKVEEGTIKNSANDIVDLYDHHVLNCSEHLFRDLDYEKF